MNSDIPDSPLPPDQQRAVSRVLASQPALLRPRPLPIQKRVVLAWLVSAVLLMAATIGLFLGRSRIPGAERVLEYILGAYFIAALALHVVAKVAIRRHARALLNPNERFVCLRCHYPLRTRPDVGQCPECGTYYRRSEVIRAWNSVFRPPRPRK